MDFFGWPVAEPSEAGDGRSRDGGGVWMGRAQHTTSTPLFRATAMTVLRVPKSTPREESQSVPGGWDNGSVTYPLHSSCLAGVLRDRLGRGGLEVAEGRAEQPHCKCCWSSAGRQRIFWARKGRREGELGCSGSWKKRTSAGCCDRRARPKKLVAWAAPPEPSQTASPPRARTHTRGST